MEFQDVAIAIYNVGYLAGKFIVLATVEVHDVNELILHASFS